MHLQKTATGKRIKQSCSTEARRHSHLAVMSSLGHGTNDMYWFILPILLPLMLDQFKMDYTAAGFLMTAFLFVIALLSFFMGWASDKVSPPIIIGLGFLLSLLLNLYADGLD